MQTDVLIVGAGPTGLTVANLLARSHINFRIIDAKAGPIDESRALVMHARTLELLDKLDLANQAIIAGQKLTAVHFLIEGKSAGVMNFDAPGHLLSPYHYSLVYEQSQTERLLLEGLAGSHTQVEWNTRLLSLTQTAQEVAAVIRHPDGKEETITTAYIVGADGASSSCRHALGVPLEGRTYHHAFFLADVDMTWSLGRNRWCVDLTQEAFFSFFPMYGGNRFRLVGTLTPEQAKQPALDLETLRKLFVQQQHLAITITDAHWISIYHVHQRMVKQFRIGRCFLVGDAAHLHTPAGGQGMNTGIGDAYNLAWKLALVINKQAHPDLLESYEQERLPVARAILGGTDTVFGLQVTSNPLWQRGRLFFIPPLLKLLKVLGMEKWLYQTAEQMWIKYRKSPAVSKHSPHDGRHSVKAGDRAPYGCFKDGTGLFEQLKGVKHHLLLFEGMQSGANFQGLQEKIEDLLKDYQFPVALHLVSAENDTLQKTYGTRTPHLFFIRPDGYIGYSGQAGDLEGFRAYLNSVFMRQDAREHAALHAPSPANLGA